ncbi:cell division protein FtsX [Szabonella alba]|uniref:Cell division protein FtsX n=1 Tax=Szabonella alba TaxID=2804194 RepID=A0A8K0V9X0_9RHOB|nr:cell division protein FtsX [Szabonella alba]MBL4918339.1 cell division protein FtsX [Szabonella alba]
MRRIIARLRPFLAAEGHRDNVVPPSGHTAWLTTFTAGAMTFLAVFALALSLAASRMADRWEGALARTATIRISAPPDQIELQTRAVLDLLATTPGIASARRIERAESLALLEPWFGPDLPLDALPLPQLVELTETEAGYDTTGLRLRLSAEAPGAVLDDHTRWRRPLVLAAERLNLLGLVSIGLIATAMGAMIVLAANASLAANAQVIRVLRLVGARDSYIVRAFTRRFTRRAFLGALAGTAAGMAGIALLPAADAAGGFLTGLGFQGAGWLLPLLLPPAAALVAFFATRAAAFRKLKELT